MTFLFASLVAIGAIGLFLVRSKLDVTAVMTVYLVALFGVNARWVVPGAGAIATPAMVIAVAAAWWWAMARLSPKMAIDRRPNHVRYALLFHVWFIALSWGLARMRALSTLEVNGSNIALISTIGLTGVALLIADGVESRERLDTLLRRVVYAGAALSIVGLLQFAFRLDLDAIISFPGLVQNAEPALELGIRGGLPRAKGTALHAIEFGVVLAMILPLAIHFAMRGTDKATRRRFVFITAVIAAGIPLGVSRSGVLAIILGLLVTGLAWTWRERIIGAAVAAGGVLTMGIMVPGLLGTFRYLLFDSGTDPSVTARLERIPLVENAYVEAPWLGAGIGTFSPDEDFLLDNEFYSTLLETGLVGLIVVLTMIAVAIFACRRVRLRSNDHGTSYLAFAIMAGVVVLPVSMVTFDAFFYRILMGVTFILLGASGALWRLVVRESMGQRRPSDVVVS